LTNNSDDIQTDRTYLNDLGNILVKQRCAALGLL